MWKKFTSSYGSFGKKSIWYINIISKWKWMQPRGFLKTWFSVWLPELQLWHLECVLSPAECLFGNRFNGEGTSPQMDVICNAVTALLIVNITYDTSCFSETYTAKEVITLRRSHHTSSAFCGGGVLFIVLVSFSLFSYCQVLHHICSPTSVLVFFLFLFFGAVKNPFNSLAIIMKLLWYGCYCNKH